MKVIYSQIGGANLTIQLIKKFEEELKWKPTFINTPNDEGKIKLQDHFRNTGIVVSRKIRQGIFDYSYIREKRSIDKSIINKLSKFQSNVMSRFEDSSGYNASFTDRLNFYYDALNFWNSIILEKKPKLFFSYTLPHLQSDYPLYLLCKYIYSIPVIFFDGYPHFGNRFSISNSMEELEKPFLNEYKKLKNKNVTNKVNRYLLSIRKSDYEQKPVHIKNYFDYLNSRSGTLNDIMSIISLTFKGTILSKSNYSIKKNRIEWGKKGSRMNNLEHIIYKRKLAKGAKLLQKYYQKYAINLENNKNFFYFPAPYQPEASTTISVGIYENLLQVLSMISESMPDNYQIFYKEHPSIFEPTQKGALSRTFDFYDKLLKLPKVKLISHKANTYKLIKKSKGVIGISGSTLWYSFVKLKPTIIIGNHWLSGSKSIFTVNTHNELTRAINKIIKGYKINKDDVSLYAQAIYNSTIKNLKIAGGRTEKAYGDNYESSNTEDVELLKLFNAVKKNAQKILSETL